MEDRFSQQLLVQAAAVDTDPDGDSPILANIHNSLDPVLAADIAGIDADLAGTAFCCGNGQLIIEMDIRYQRQRAFPADLSKGSGCFHIGHSQSCDLASGRSQCPNLGKGTFHISGFGIEHGLNHHRGTAADGDSSNLYLSCHNINL